MQTELVATRTPRRAPLRLVIVANTGTMRIVGGDFGKEGAPLSLTKTLRGGIASVDGFVGLGYGETLTDAASDLFSKIKQDHIAAHKRAPKNSARAAHKRKTPRTATTATLDIRGMESDGVIVLVVGDVLTKNDRYGRGKGGTFEKTASKWFKAAVQSAAIRAGFCVPIKVPAIKSGPHKRNASTTFGECTIQSGLWSLEVLSIWPHQRHLDGAGELANGDADAPLSMVRDAMQRAGIIDDDMRIVSDRTLAIYRKDERRTIARLTRIDDPALQRHHHAIESLLLAELLADNAASPAAC